MNKQTIKPRINFLGEKKGRTMNPLIQLKQTTSVFFIAFGLACFGLSPAARAVTPPPDGGYANRNTAEGDSALFSLTTGSDNTAVGFQALLSVGDGSDNTAVGFQALQSNTGSENTAVGVGALQNNTGPFPGTGSDNTAIGMRRSIATPLASTTRP